MAPSLKSFITRWRSSGAEERANKDLFFTELCDILDVPRPNPKTGDPAHDTYVFEADVRVPHEGETTAVRKIDVYREGCFLLEAKQGAGFLSKKLHAAKRDTPAWEEAMNGARGQALGYARMMEQPPPFLIVADIGYCFDLYASFDSTDHYRPFPNPRSSRIFFTDLEKNTDLLRRVLTDPLTLDPARLAARVTHEIAESLATLAQALEGVGHSPEIVATFLMRCLFTMFAERVGLLPNFPKSKLGLFTGALENLWLPNPRSFVAGVEALWRAMNSGTDFGFVGKLLRFNGGLFASPSALPLKTDDLRTLLNAAKRNWAEVEPAIFGTLIERALDPRERHALGAHYTPRAYVERLVRPTIEEPLRADWDLAQAQIRQRVTEAEEAKTAKARKAKLQDAQKVARAFHQRLCRIRVLDPACGSGNFLYVALDLFQRLEGEVLAKLEALGEKQQFLHAESIRVSPAQFLGIEKKRWAKEIAELVLWIGYLQHHVRAYGSTTPPPEPVLQDYRNIEWGDAILRWDSTEEVRGSNGKVVTRWDGETMRIHPVTGAEVPDEAAQTPLLRYINPQEAAWPPADFVVTNPPFVASRNLRSDLGDGYVDALQEAYPHMRTNADFVMWFWDRAAKLVISRKVRRMGMITTSRIRMQQNQPPVVRALESGARIVFAIPDHAWPLGVDSAKVRVAMTVLTAADDNTPAVLALAPDHDQVATTRGRPVEEGELSRFVREAIDSDLSPSVSLAGIEPLQSNSGLDSAGMKPYARSLIIDREQARALFPNARTRHKHAPEYRNGKDVGQRPRGVHVIDLFGLTKDDVATRYPVAYQYLATHTRPERATERNQRLRDEWWLFEANRPELRRALRGIGRYIVTVENSPVRAFVFLAEEILPDQKLRVVASNDALVLAVLSSRVHSVFAERVGGRHGVANTPVYNSRCFAAFPFPIFTPKQEARVRDLGERLDAHRSHQLTSFPKLTLTSMYNVLAKVRSGDALSEKEKDVYSDGLVAVLAKIHDELDSEVISAYGWPKNVRDEEILGRLVALNRERRTEERTGLIRWLRREFQETGGEQSALGVEEKRSAEVDREDLTPWPRTLPDQVAAIRDLMLRGTLSWSAKQVAARFRGAGVKSVAPVLDSLAALGLVVAFERSGERTWRAARVR